MDGARATFNQRRLTGRRLPLRRAARNAGLLAMPRCSQCRAARNEGGRSFLPWPPADPTVCPDVNRKSMISRQTLSENLTNVSCGDTEVDRKPFILLTLSNMARFVHHTILSARKVGTHLGGAIK
jgi:hypothetical protein